MGQSPQSFMDPAARVLGYLNFSSGAFDPMVWRAVSDLYAAVEPEDEKAASASCVAENLLNRLTKLESSEPAFRDSSQARAVISILFTHFLPAYAMHHADLLEHQPAGSIERPFFIAAAAQAILSSGGPWNETGVVIEQAIAKFDDYVGWRPIAILENGRLSEPYPKEKVRPIPLFEAGAGVAHGRYAKLVSGALEILFSAPVGLLEQADFDLALVEELAIDPRAFDFLHPAASRPNYLFGLWDPTRIDGHGHYRRLVVQQATLDGILSWPMEAPVGVDGQRPSHQELQREASAVLAGVMLMAAGLSGRGPGAARASIGLADLLPKIASYRDEFYQWHLTQLEPNHQARLAEETRKLRQPFGGVRRHINSLLAARRAVQVESVGLISVLARLGRSESAERLSRNVPAASARMASRLTSQVVSAHRLAAKRDAAGALERLNTAVDLLFRAVGCGAMVDPWNILGLAGQFPLHEPGGESLPDPRVEDLVLLVGSILHGYAEVWRVARLKPDEHLAGLAAESLEQFAVWWDRHATTTVSGVPHVSGRETLDSAREVIESLERRRACAPAVPPPGFWRSEVASFSSPRSHAQAAESLLNEGDLDGAMGLLVHWASLLEGEAIERSGSVWLAMASRWMSLSLADSTDTSAARTRRFLELVEANTGTVVDIVERAGAAGDLMTEQRHSQDDSDIEDRDDDAVGEESVASAYESMVWRDSTDDGIDGGMLDVDAPRTSGEGELASLEQAAEFLWGVSKLLQEGVIAWSAEAARDAKTRSQVEIDSVVGWRHMVRRMERSLVRAANALAVAGSVPDSPRDTDAERTRVQRDVAIERLTESAVQLTETRWMLSTYLLLVKPRRSVDGSIGRFFADCLRGDVHAVKESLESLRSRLLGKMVLYIPLSRGGRPSRVVRARCRERLLERMAGCLPRLGLVIETAEVVNLAKSLETKRPKGEASVSEFDRVFESAASSLVERIVESAQTGNPREEEITSRILDGLSLLVPRLLETWLTHARQLRLSVLERVRDDKAFSGVVQFVERYGTGIFTQQLFGPASLRGILRYGVRSWIDRLIELSESMSEPPRLIVDIQSGVISKKQAALKLRLVLEAIAENHAEYRDWNSTTTQSDRGEHLHILLEFLRIKAEYDRIGWTLRPVGMAHRVLAQRRITAAASAWRARMRDETSSTASELAARLVQLQEQWGIRLASIADRVGRPFSATLEQDELEALVEPAARELFTGEPIGSGEALERASESFLGTASGSGMEIPDWLDRLSQKVEQQLDVPVDVVPFRTHVSDAVAWKHIEWPELYAILVPSVRDES